MSLEVLDIAKAAGVTMLTLPPHCSHKLQPLDISVFGPFKAYYNTSVDSWMLHNPGIPITIYQVGECVGESFLKSVTPSNIISGFRKSGIYPLNINIFEESDFLMSAVSDRPQNLVEPQDSERCVTPPREENLQDDSPMATCSRPSASNDSRPYISPKEFRGFPKAPPRKTTGRSRGKSVILTSTPEKAAIEEKTLKKREQLEEKERRSVRRALIKKPKTKLDKIELSSSDSNEDDNDDSDESSDRPTSKDLHHLNFLI